MSLYAFILVSIFTILPLSDRDLDLILNNGFGYPQPRMATLTMTFQLVFLSLHVWATQLPTMKLQSLKCEFDYQQYLHNNKL